MVLRSFNYHLWILDVCEKSGMKIDFNESYIIQILFGFLNLKLKFMKINSKIKLITIFI